jgi:hypothetical protein
MDDKRLSEALEAFRFDTEANPKEPSGWNLLSALEGYRTTLRLDPGSRKAQTMLRLLGGG